MNAGRRTVLSLIFAPFVVNLAMTLANAFSIPSDVWRYSYELALVTFLSRLYGLQSLGIVCVQVVLGLIILGRMVDRRKLYDVSKLWSLRSVALIIGLVIFAFSLFFIEGIINTYAYYGGNWELYRKAWMKVVSHTPMWARYLNALVAPLTAGFFEEAVWRGYGIAELEKFVSQKSAVLIQATAFALWHVNPLHIAIVFPIGLAYGIAFSRRRELVTLTAAHVITDLIGFSSWIL